MKMFITENQAAGWMLGEIEALKKYKFFIIVFGVRILHNSELLNKMKTLDGRFRLF